MKTSSNPFLARSLPFIICMLASFFYVYEFFLRVSPGAITQELMTAFHFDAKNLGLMGAFFFYGYAPMQIPAGLLMDRFGPRLLMSLAMGLCALGALLFGTTNHSFTLYFSRFMVGVCSSFAYIGALVLASRWFHSKYFALIAGLVQLMGCLGAIVGEAPVAYLAQTLGWRAAFIQSSLLGFVLTILFWMVIRDQPYSSNQKTTLSHPQKASKQMMKNLRKVLKYPQTWWIAACGFASWGPITIFATLWGVPFLIASYGISSTEAAKAISIIWIGIAIGGPILGWFSNYIRSRRIPLIIGSSLSLVTSLAMVYYSHLSWFGLYFCLFFFGVGCSSQAVTFGLVHDNNETEVEGTAIGFNNMAVVFAGTTLQPLVGILLKASWSGAYTNGIPIYSCIDYQKALWVLPMCSCIALISTLFFIKETACHPVGKG